MAGPLFTKGERDFNAQLARELRDRGVEVFLPQEKEERDLTAREVFDYDVQGIDGSDAVVACMDGPDPDSGTCWEVGYAYRRRPIVLYRTDFRREAGHLGPYNLMMTQSADRVMERCEFASVEALAARIVDELRSLGLL